METYKHCFRIVLIITLVFSFSFVSFASDFICPNSNQRYLEDYEINSLSTSDLRLAINEIYARKGRKFQTKDLNEYFSSKSWYYPLYSEDEIDDSMLNKYERTNIDRLAMKRNGDPLLPIESVSQRYDNSVTQNDDTIESTKSSKKSNTTETVKAGKSENTNKIKESSQIVVPSGNTGLDFSFSQQYLTDYGKYYLQYMIDHFGMNFMFNWEYPEKFTTERNEVFKLIYDVYKYQLEHVEYESEDLHRGSSAHEKKTLIPGAVLLRLKNNLISTDYFYQTENYNDYDVLYYGELKNERPNGYGVLIRMSDVYYGGYFKDGVPQKYGAYFTFDKTGLEWECSNPQIVTATRFTYSGDTIVYYNADKDMLAGYNEGRKEAYSRMGSMYDKPYEEFDDMETMDLGGIPSNESHVNRYLLLKCRPMVCFEGDSTSLKKSNGTFYYDKYVGDPYRSVAPKIRKVNSCYGPVMYQGETRGVIAYGKGTLYKSNGEKAYSDDTFNGLDFSIQGN